MVIGCVVGAARDYIYMYKYSAVMLIIITIGHGLEALIGQNSAQAVEERVAHPVCIPI